MKRILLVDDEPGMLQALRMILTGEGHEIETAWSSKEACDLLGGKPFDLVVTDFHMPGMKGDELALRIKRQFPSMPVIMLTGSAEVLRRNSRVLPGVDLLIGKPFNIPQFVSEVARLLEGSSPGKTTEPVSCPATAG